MGAYESAPSTHALYQVDAQQMGEAAYASSLTRPYLMRLDSCRNPEALLFRLGNSTSVRR